MKGRLGLMYGKTRVFTASFSKWGTRKNWLKQGPSRIPTMLLVNVCTTNGEEVAEHIWIRNVTPFLDLGDLENGDRLRFKGRVDSFPKGSHEIDFHIVDVEGARKVKVKKKRVA